MIFLASTRSIARSRAIRFAIHRVDTSSRSTRVMPCFLVKSSTVSLSINPKSIHDAFERRHWSERPGGPDTVKPKLHSRIDIAANVGRRKYLKLLADSNVVNEL